MTFDILINLPVQYRDMVWSKTNPFTLSFLVWGVGVALIFEQFMNPIIFEAKQALKTPVKIFGLFDF